MPRALLGESALGMPCREESCFGDFVVGVVFTLRCLELIKKVFGITSRAHVAKTRVSEDAVSPLQDWKFKVQQVPVTMPVVIEIVSDSEEERM